MKEKMLEQKIYTGKVQSCYTLEIYCDRHRHSQLWMRSATEHVDYQLRNQSTMVRYLLDTIKCNDLLLMASVANIQCDQDSKGKLHDYKLAISFFLLACPAVQWSFAL